MTGPPPANAAPDPCEFLPWDSEFFGVPIARVLGDVLGDDSCRRIDAWCAARGIACLYFLARSDDAGTARLAQPAGFRLVDVRVTLDLAMAEAREATARVDPLSSCGGALRHFEPRDAGAVRRIARAGFHDTRFYFDGLFPGERCDDLYDVWARASCEGKSGAVLVAERDGEAAGFVTCDALDAETGAIGLIGVDAPWQGKGVGGSLASAAIGWFRGGPTFKRVSVVTQGRNVAAQRLYQRCGFKTRQVQLYFHKWYGTRGGAG